MNEDELPPEEEAAPEPSVYTHCPHCFEELSPGPKPDYCPNRTMG